MSTPDEIKAAQDKLDAEKASKIEFTEAQQAKVNELINTAMGRAGNDARQKAATLEAESTALKTQLAEAQIKLAAANSKSDKSGGKESTDALQLQIEEMKRANQANADELNRSREAFKAKEREASDAREEAVNVRKTIAIQSAASKSNFVNGEVVAKLTADNIKWDATKGKFTVVGDNGQPRLNASFDEMTLDEFYSEFAAKNPYLVRGDARPGVGSTGSQRFDISSNGKLEVKTVFGKESSAAAAQKLMKENPAEYARMKKIAIESHLIAG